jgi:hypothetical protein
MQRMASRGRIRLTPDWITPMRSLTFSLVAGLVFVAPAAAGSSGPWRADFDYPGSPALLRSPTRQASLVLESSPTDASGLTERRLTLRDADGKAITQYDFDRRVDGRWSPSGRSIFLNDYQGSNVADCLLPYRQGDKVGFVSLAAILREKGSGPVGSDDKPTETPDNSHYYLTCRSWLGEGSVAVELSGRTDAGGEFSYAFKFDIARRRFKLD